MVWRYAFEDPLTGLANRRKIDEWTVLDEGGQSRPAVLVCDVDGLKEVNDRRGHPAGDAVLRGVATVLTGIASATTGSLVARLGGDEFCIVLPHSTLSDAERFARDAGRLLRRDTAESVSLSWGAAGFGPQTRSGQQLIAAADAALIEAKRLGPGRFSVGVADTQGMPGSSGRRSATSDVKPPAKDDLVPAWCDSSTNTHRRPQLPHWRFLPYKCVQPSARPRGAYR